MRAFTFATVTFLALTAVAIFNSTSQEQTYHNRLAVIASQVNSQSTTWKAAAPQRFREQSFEQVKMLMGAKFGGPKLAPVELSLTQTPPPASFDSRTNWASCQSIQEVRDQANCGSCWAFGAVEAMSDRICIHSGKGSKLGQTPQVRISSQDLLTCCSSCGYGCQGGFPSMAWNFWANQGLVTGNAYGDNSMCKPYFLAKCAHHTTSPKYPACPPIPATPSCTNTCNPSYTAKSYSDDKHFGQTPYSVEGESTMMSEISTNGPIEVAFTVYEDFLTYKTGVYQHTSGRMLGGHAVKAIGYGTEGSTKYWIIANSWNETWGDKGFFKILRGSDECGIESSGVAGLPKTA